MGAFPSPFILLTSIHWIRMHPHPSLHPRPSLLLPLVCGAVSIHAHAVYPLHPHPSASICIRHFIRVHQLLPPVFGVVVRRAPKHSPFPSFCSRPSTRSASIRIQPHPTASGISSACISCFLSFLRRVPEH